MVMNDPGNETNKMRPSDRCKGLVYFVLATICALPFLLISYFAIPSFVSGKPLPHDLIMASALFIFVFIAATIGTLVFIPLAWRNGPRFCKPLLVIYSLVTLIYYIVLTSAGTW
jgi:hypothetical protein